MRGKGKVEGGGEGAGKGEREGKGGRGKGKGELERLILLFKNNLLIFFCNFTFILFIIEKYLF